MFWVVLVEGEPDDDRGHSGGTTNPLEDVFWVCMSQGKPIERPRTSLKGTRSPRRSVPTLPHQETLRKTEDEPCLLTILGTPCGPTGGAG